MAEALETIAIPGTNLNPTRIALGTWAIGGWMWGGPYYFAPCLD